MTSAHPLYRQAIQTFQDRFAEWSALDVHEPGAMTLATCDQSSRVTARTVLLRGVDERGFVFYTNANSDKSRQLSDNSQAALLFYWDRWHEQVRVEGRAEKVSDDESDQYWAKRPRASQIGAWASRQSEQLESMDTLAARVAEAEARFENVEVPRPAYWYGFRIVPERIEFWYGRDARLHERHVYQRRAEGWVTFLLYP